MLPAARLAAILDEVPDAWLRAAPGDLTPAGRRAGYLAFLTGRLAAARAFVEEAERARAQLV
ncbi:MAG TPA: hypothetical protein DD490_27590 [Acidobacteria bacterium]|nr:hypothetical protein [Acidobacteriota bacterium]